MMHNYYVYHSHVKHLDLLITWRKAEMRGEKKVSRLKTFLFATALN